MPPPQSIVGTFERVRWTSPEGNFLIGYLEDGSLVKGRAESGELVPGLVYQFYGKGWSEHPQHGRQFNFSQFMLKEPLSRHGVTTYLERYAAGVGPVVAAKLWDLYGQDAVKVLRMQPEAVAELVPHLTVEKARIASQQLKEIADVEDTKIQLTSLFAGRGFPGVLVDECIGKWGILAPSRIRRDPFCLLVEKMPGCGFARCDRLYIDLGLPADRLMRQVTCLWNILRSESSGHTWLDAELALVKLEGDIGSAKVKRKKAVVWGRRAGWLATHRDEDGKLWLADAERAASERFVAAKTAELLQWEPKVEVVEDLIEESR